MTGEVKMTRITVFVNHGIASSAPLVGPPGKGFPAAGVATGRSAVLQERHGFMAALSPGMSLGGDPLDVISTLIPPELEDDAISYVAQRHGLDHPGRGTVYSEEVTVVKAHPACISDVALEPSTRPARTLDMLMGVCCIVQRKQGDSIARVALETGACVPAITFGSGTGLRDKLGILRITIPAEKEVIRLAVSSYDAEPLMDRMVDAGKLDQPGRGFIYLFPVKQGVVNMKVSRGHTQQAASVEQIVAALDEIKGGAEWRRRESAGSTGKTSKRTYLHNLIEMKLYCDEGRAGDLVAAAMAAGAPGATISKLKHVCVPESPASRISPAREVSAMIVQQKQIEDIVKAVEAAGGFDDRTHGLVQVQPVPKACTYLGKAPIGGK